MAVSVAPYLLGRLRARLFRLAIAFVLVIPGVGGASLGTGLIEAHASGVCYWSGTVSDNQSASPAWSTTVSSYIEYNIGYDCNLNPVAIYVSYFSDSLSVSNSDPLYHQVTSSYICTYTDAYHLCYPPYWYIYQPIGCTGSCTVTRYAYPNLTITYDPGNFVFEHYAGCDVHGGTWCETYHYFNQRTMYVYGHPQTFAATTTASSTLSPGETLSAGQHLLSSNGRYELIMQGDGNLVLYSPTTYLWASWTQNHPGDYVLMQGDGNLVIYRQGGSPADWASGSAGNPGAYLLVQDDGNVVIYRQGGSPAVWSTNTCCNRP